MVHLQITQPLLHQSRVSRLPFRPQQPVEQPDVGKHRREQLTIIFRFIRRHRLTIEQDLSGYRLIQAGQQHSQRRFPATVAANQKDQLTALEGHINRPDRKAVVRIMKGDIAQLESLPVGMRLRLRKFSAIRRERKFIQLVERHLRAEQSGQRANRGKQRRAQE